MEEAVLILPLPVVVLEPHPVAGRPDLVLGEVLLPELVVVLKSHLAEGQYYLGAYPQRIEVLYLYIQ
jgi:hypothetical protein